MIVAVRVTPFDVPLIVSWYAPGGVPELPEHAVSPMIITNAPTKPTFERRRRAKGSVKSSSTLKPIKTTWRREIGGNRNELGGAAELPAVAIATVTVPGALMLAGTVQLPFGMDPVQERVTGPTKPPRKFAVTVGLLVPPGAVDTVCVDGEKLKSHPVPLSVAVCVLAPAVTAKVDASAPMSPDAGLNVTLYVHVVFAGVVATVQLTGLPANTV